MKKLSARHKIRLLKLARRNRRRSFRRPKYAVSQRRGIAQESFTKVQSLLPKPVRDYECRAGFCTIIPPDHFSIYENYEATLSFILDMRRLFHDRIVKSPDGRRNLRAFADFAAIKSIEPAAGLMLAAEVDRWRIASGKQPKSFDSGWQPEVRRFFSQAGLFELLGIQQQGLDAPESGLGVETLQFARGFSVYGEIGSQLRDRLEKLCGKSIGPRTLVYDSIAEAIANTRHAYPSGISIWPSKLAGRWWASGSWDSHRNVVRVHLYDQGVGIPATLPRSAHYTDIVRRLPLVTKLNPEHRDDQLIEAALEIGRTSTGQQGRGKGLAEMANWIETRGSGSLRILSGRGCVTYRPGGAIDRQERKAAFPGTFIEWEVDLHD